jgi:ABC-type phosphate transport system substrate-binding protein
MFKKLSIAGAAVAAVLSAGSAFAISPAGPFAVSLTISGASAFQNAVESELSSGTSSICQAGTYNKFQSTNNDFRAYTCNLVAGVIGAGGEAAAIYYRGEGGSVFGLSPLLGGTRFNGAAVPQPKRLALSNCPTSVTPGSTAAVLCATGVLSLATESSAPVAGLENAASQLGFSDVEPTQFFGENYPSASAIPLLQPALNAAERNTLNAAAEALVGQSFGVFVNSNVPTTNLSKTVIANIFQGVYADWSAVPNGNGSTVTAASLPIKLCRREQGSGTQVAASIFFNDYPNTSTPFASEANQGALDVGLGGGGVVENAATSAVRTCISGNPGAIGTISAEASDPASTGRKMIKIDGQGAVDPIANNLGVPTAAGQYAFWFEEVAIKKPGLSGAALALANKLIPVTKVQSSGPTTPNITFLSPFNAAVFPPVTPANKQPVSCLRRNKVSTGPAVWQC